MSVDCVLDAASVDGQDTWYVGYNLQGAQEFIRDCGWWAQKLNQAVVGTEQEFLEGSGDKILAYTIRFATGWKITALSSRPTNLRAKKGRIVIDEAAFHPDLRELIKAAMAVLVWGGKSRVDIISTHNGVDNAFNELVDDVRAKKLNWSLHTVTFDEALRQGLFKRICMVNGLTWSAEREVQWRDEIFAFYGEGADEELNCVPAKSGGTYIGRTLIERAMPPEDTGRVLRLAFPDEFKHEPEESRIGQIADIIRDHIKPYLLELPRDRHHFFGQDFGRTSDRSVLAPGYLDQDLRRVFPFAIELLNCPFEQQKQIAIAVIDGLPMFFAAAFDATGNGQYLAEVVAQKFGKTLVEEVHLTDKWYDENLPPFRASFEDDVIRIPRDTDHLNDLGAFKTIKGRPRMPAARTKSHDKKAPLRHGDAGIAYALAYYASSKPIPTYAYESPSTQGRRSFNDPRHITNRPKHDDDPRPTFLGGTGIRSRKGGIL